MSSIAPGLADVELAGQAAGAGPRTVGDVFAADPFAFGAIDGVLLVVALAAVLVILVIVYRSPFLPLAVISTAVFGLCLAGLVVYELTKAGVLVLNGQTQGILSILVVGASVDYSLLLVARYREELQVVASPRTAMGRAIKGTIEPVAASAATVIAGLLCLLLSDLASNRSLGPVAAIGIVGALAAARGAADRRRACSVLVLAPQGRGARSDGWRGRDRRCGSR